MRSSSDTTRGVELDRELAAGEGECVPQRSVQLGQPTEGERILQVPRRPRLPERASVEKRAQAGQRLGEARVRANLGDRRVQQGQVGGERLQVDRAGDVHRLEQAIRVRQGERSHARRERVRVDERDRLLRLELDLGEEGVREVGHGGKVGLAE